MALSTTKTLPPSLPPDLLDKNYQIDNNELGKTTAVGLPRQPMPTVHSKCLSPSDALKRQWLAEAMTEFSANLPKRRANASPEVLHARKLLKIAEQQQASGIQFEGQLTVEQAKACVNTAEKAANNSAFRWLSDTVMENFNSLTSVFSQAESKLEPTPKSKTSWLEEFEVAAKPHFTIKKSPLWKPGRPPKLIVIGDGDHSSKQTQHRLKKLVQFLEQNEAITLLLVESTDPPNRVACHDVPSGILNPEMAPARCVGADHAESKKKGLVLMQEMWTAAFNTADALYRAAKAAGVDSELLNPREVMSGVSKYVYWEIEKAINEKTLRDINSLAQVVTLDMTQIEKMAEVYVTARNKFYRHMEDSMLVRDQNLMKKIDMHYKTEESIVAVYGDAHVQENANQLLQKYDCWILDDKSANHKLPKKERN